MGGSYATCNEPCKDQINDLLVQAVCNGNTSHTRDRIITLDHSHNGTCSAFQESGRYSGHYEVIQKDKAVAKDQTTHWKLKYPLEANRFHVSVEDIAKNFDAHPRWINRDPVRLWNIDSTSFLQGVCLDVVNSLVTHADNCIAADPQGTIVALTFIADGQGNHLARYAKTKPVQWAEQAKLYRKMGNIELAQTHLKTIKETIESTVENSEPRVTFAPIDIRLDVEQLGGNLICVDNSIIYHNAEGKKPKIRMMFALYRVTYTRFARASDQLPETVSSTYRKPAKPSLVLNQGILERFGEPQQRVLRCYAARGNEWSTAGELVEFWQVHGGKVDPNNRTNGVRNAHSTFRTHQFTHDNEEQRIGHECIWAVGEPHAFCERIGYDNRRQIPKRIHPTLARMLFPDYADHHPTDSPSSQGSCSPRLSPSRSPTPTIPESPPGSSPLKRMRVEEDDGDDAHGEDASVPKRARHTDPQAGDSFGWRSYFNFDWIVNKFTAITGRQDATDEKVKEMEAKHAAHADRLAALEAGRARVATISVVSRPYTQLLKDCYGLDIRVNATKLRDSQGRCVTRTLSREQYLVGKENMRKVGSEQLICGPYVSTFTERLTERFPVVYLGDVAYGALR